jgi:hypothetical protein
VDLFSVAQVVQVSAAQVVQVSAAQVVQDLPVPIGHS